MTFGVMELAILLFLVFLILGPKRIVSLFRALGRGVKDFTEEFGRQSENKELPEKKEEKEEKDTPAGR